MTWLEERGAVRLADGSATSWAKDPDAAEALYDIARDVLVAIYRPSRILQHVTSVAALVRRPEGSSDNARRRGAAQRARRALIEQPVVYFDQSDPDVKNHLRSTAIVEDLERLTGLRVERRADGMLLVDTGGLSEDRFPGNGVVAQAALLLLGAACDRVVDPDARRLPRHQAPSYELAQRQLIDLVDAGLPATALPALDESAVDELVAEGKDETGAEGDAPAYPFLSESFLRTTMKELVYAYGPAFGERWRANPDRLRAEAVALLTRFGLVEPVPGGLLVLPLAGRYRNVNAKLRRRDEPASLFAMKASAKGRKA